MNTIAKIRTAFRIWQQASELVTMADIMCDCEDSNVFKAGYHILARWEQPFYSARGILNNHLNNCLDNDVNENTPYPGGLI